MMFLSSLTLAHLSKSGHLKRFETKAPTRKLPLRTREFLSTAADGGDESLSKRIHEGKGTVVEPTKVES